MTNINLTGDEVLSRTYEDLLSPSFKCIGGALEKIIEIPCYTMIIPTKFLKKNLKKLDEKINGIPEEDRIPIIPELGIPLLRDLSYYSNEVLSDMFIELLAKSANKNTVNGVLPSYIKIIENLSVDEALILEYIYEKSKIRNNVNQFHMPCISLNKSKKEGEDKGSYIPYYDNLSELYLVDGLNSIENMNVYIENLISLGIINIPPLISIPIVKIYENLENILRKKVPQYFNHIESEISDSEELKINKGIIELTKLGSSFLSAIHCED